MGNLQKKKKYEGNAKDKKNYIQIFLCIRTVKKNHQTMSIYTRKQKKYGHYF